MRSLIRNLFITVAVLLLCIWWIIPPEKKLRLGRDLRGGVSLVYSVQMRPGDPPDTIAKVIDVIKERVDPQGLSEIAIVQQGRDRIEVTMPLPNATVKRLKQDYEQKLSQIARAGIDPSEFERVMRAAPAERDSEIARLAGPDAARAGLLRSAAAAYDAHRSALDRLTAARAELDAAKAAGADEGRIRELDNAVNDAEQAAVEAEIAYEKARDEALTAAVSIAEVRQAIEASTEKRVIIDRRTNQRAELESPREQKLADLKKRHPAYAAQIDEAVAAFDLYAAQRTRLDDPADLKRMLAGAGVLEFRITVNPSPSAGSHPQEDRLRRELRERGPRNVQSTDARWYKINKIDTWFDTVQQLEHLKADPAGFFAGRGYVVEEYAGDYYMLCWDTPGSRLTRAEGDWAVAAAYQSTDPQTGGPAISFEMDPRGAVLLGELTRNHVGDQMAVLLDDQVYTAPNLRSRISRNGQITGSFSDAEIRYIVRVLSAGSLQAKLSPEPISESTLAPELGADNLRQGMRAGIASFIVIAIFMVVYYFSCGLIAVFALIVNLIIILGMMAMGHAAFTLPGIAGIILTFGQAVDSNVLIYERMREEFKRGADMRTAVRLGFSKAFASIVDGNVANLIICAVLYRFGTQEIRGFAITLSIGVLATLFAALVVSRLIFTILVDHVGWSRTSMLPMAVPAVQRALEWKVNWLRLRWFFVTASILLTGLGIIAAVVRGPQMLDTEFRGGTQIELQFKDDPQSDPQRPRPLMLTRQDVLNRVEAIAEEAPVGSTLAVLREAEVVAVNPAEDGVSASRFQIKVPAADEREVLDAVLHRFSDVVESRPALRFDGADQAEWRRAPVYRVVGKTLGENIDRPALRDDVSAYVGGAAVVLENLTPPPTRASLESRLDQMRQRPEFSDTLARQREIRVLEGDDSAVRTAVLLVRDDQASFFENDDRWGSEVAAREWRLVVEALTHTSHLASVQTFSPTIARTFTAQAVVSIVLSVVLLTIYVWVRFGAARWALAATLPLFHDVIVIVGFIALAQMLYENPATNAFAVSLGILPFKIDLQLVAALLTIAGFSLNDTIIILDRIRENKGKQPFATAQQVNDSINQTISRTIITSGTTLFVTIVLYLWGGPAVRGFAYAFNLGVFVGIYSSIAISAPLVWSRRFERQVSSPGSPSAQEPALAGV